MDPLKIQYVFSLPNDRTEEFEVLLDRSRLEISDDLPPSLPEWTRLEREQCPRCPLSPETSPHCPLAGRLVGLISFCEDLLSHDEMHVDVITEERTVSKRTTAQLGVSSLLGLIMASSGCPQFEFFKPMARFHLPLASTEETIYRATSTYLLAQYFRSKEGGDADLELRGLTEIYENLQSLNIAMAARIRSAVNQDAAVNAIILLDFLARALPSALEESLDEIRYLFSPYLADGCIERS